MRDLFIEQYFQSFSLSKRQFLNELLIKLSGNKPSSAQEINRNLKRLLEIANTQNDEPLTSAFTFNDGALIYAPVIQGYYRQVGGDAYSLLNGLINISQLNDSHRALFAEFLLRALEESIDKLEQRLEVSELLAKNKANGFTGAFQIDFSNLGLYTDFLNSDLLFDEYKAQKLTQEQMIEVNFGKVGYLPKAKSNQLDIDDIYLKYPDSSVSQLDLVYEGSNIKNVIDRDLDSYFAPMILSTEQLINESGAIQKLTLELGSDYYISTVVIDPIGKYPFKVNSITYDNRSLEVPTYEDLVTVTDSSVLNTRINSKTIIDFSRVRATHVHITLTQDTYAYVNVNTDDETGNVVRYTNPSNVQTVVETQLPDVAEVFNVASNTNATSIPYYKYEFGIAEIGVYDSVYRDTGFYISPEQVIQNCMTLGIDRSFNVEDGVDPTSYSLKHTLSIDVQTDESNRLAIKAPMMPVGSTDMVEVLRMNTAKQGVLSYPIEVVGDITDVFINNAAATNYTISVDGYTLTITDSLSPTDIVSIVYTPIFIKYPERKYRFTAQGRVEEDIDNNGIVGIDERFLVVFYQSKNNVKIRHRLVMHSFNNKLIRLNSLDTLYSIQDPNKYRNI